MRSSSRVPAGGNLERLSIPPQRGVSLLELLIVIGAVAVLLAIALPAFRGARSGARELAVMAHQREVGAMLRHYAADRNEAFPFYGERGTNKARLCLPQDYLASLETKPESDCIDAPYWQQPIFWALHMRFQGYDMVFAARGPEFQGGPEPAIAQTGSLDTLTYTAFAPPHFWREEDPQSVEDHLPQRWTTVAFPSQKIILQRPNFLADAPTDAAAYFNADLFAWFADGHGAALRRGDLLPAAPLRMVSPQGGMPGLTTVDGLRGRDI